MEMQRPRSSSPTSRNTILTNASSPASLGSVRASDLPQVPTHSPNQRIGNELDQQIVLPTRNPQSIDEVVPSAPPSVTSVINTPDVNLNDFSPSAPPLNPASVIAEPILGDINLSGEPATLAGSAIVIPQDSVHVISESDEKSESNGSSIEQENTHLDSDQPVVAPSAPAKADVLPTQPPVAMGGGARVSVPQPEEFDVDFAKSKEKCLKQNISVQDKLELIIAYIKPEKDQRRKKSFFQVRNNNLASYTPKLRNENDHKDLIQILNKLENTVTSLCIFETEVNLLQYFLTYAENPDHKINQDVLTAIKAFLLKNYSAHFPGLIDYSQQVDSIDNRASHLGHLTDLEKGLQDEYNKCLSSNILGNRSFDFGKFFESDSISALTPQARRKIFRLALNLSNEPLNLQLKFGRDVGYYTIDKIDTIITSVIEKRDWPEVMDEMLLYAEATGNLFKLSDTSSSRLKQENLPYYYTTKQRSYGYNLNYELSKWTCDIILYILENKELHHLFDTQIFEKVLDYRFKGSSKTTKQDSKPFFLNDYISPKCEYRTDEDRYRPLNKFESVLSSAINNQTEYSFKLFEGFFEQIDPAKLNKDVQKKYQGMIDRLLKIAVENKNIDFVKILCDKGANPLCTFKDSIIFQATMWRGPITYAKIGSPMFHVLMSYIKEDDLNKSLIQISLDLKYRINFLAWLLVTPSTEFENGFTNEDLLNIIETNPIFNSISSECWTNALRLLSSKELNECNIMKFKKSSSGELPKYKFTESQILQLKGERINKLKLLMKKGASLTETNLKETIDELRLIQCYNAPVEVDEIPDGTSLYSAIGFAIKSYDKELFDFFMDTAETKEEKQALLSQISFYQFKKDSHPEKSDSEEGVIISPFKSFTSGVAPLAQLHLDIKNQLPEREQLFDSVLAYSDPNQTSKNSFYQLKYTKDQRKELEKTRDSLAWKNDKWEIARENDIPLTFYSLLENTNRCHDFCDWRDFRDNLRFKNYFIPDNNNNSLDDYFKSAMTYFDKLFSQETFDKNILFKGTSLFNTLLHFCMGTVFQDTMGRDFVKKLISSGFKFTETDFELFKSSFNDFLSNEYSSNGAIFNFLLSFKDLLPVNFRQYMIQQICLTERTDSFGKIEFPAESGGVQEKSRSDFLLDTMKTLMEDHDVVNFFNEPQDGKLLILEAVKNGHFDFLDHWISLMAPNKGDQTPLPSYNGESLLTVILNSDFKDLKQDLDKLMTNEKLYIKSDDLKELYKSAYDSGKYAICISLLNNIVLQNDLTKEEYAKMLLLSLAKLQESVKK